MSIKNTYWHYRKIDSFIDRYRIVTNAIKNIGFSAYVLSCKKRCGLTKTLREVDASSILKCMGFTGCCLDYNPVEETSKRYIPDIATDRFKEKKYEWSGIVNKEYRKQRTKNFFKLDKVTATKQEIEKRKKFKEVLAYLEKI